MPNCGLPITWLEATRIKSSVQSLEPKYLWKIAAFSRIMDNCSSLDNLKCYHLSFRYGPNNNGNSDVYFWICLYQTTPSMNATTAYWLDGNPSTWRDWYTGEPDGDSGCFTSTNFYQWGDLNCSSNQFYLCKMPAREYIKAKFSITDLIYAKSKIRKSWFYLKSKI